MLPFKYIFTVVIVCFLACCTACKSKINKSNSSELLIGFYNLDNLYDIYDDPKTFDNDFTPNGMYKWDEERYTSKLNKLSEVIQSIDGQNSPDVLGVCEVENKNVLNDLITQKAFHKSYAVIHEDSKDERGADVGLIYNSDLLDLIEYQSFDVELSKNEKDETRSILWVKLKTQNNIDTFQFIVCHFPSRREGLKKSEQNRIDAAKRCREIIDKKCKLQSENLIVLGDFNDQPGNVSLKQYIGAVEFKGLSARASDLFNLMIGFEEKNQGTYFYKGHWNVLDQILISSALTDGKQAEYVDASIGIKKEDWMIQTGKYKGYPLRTFGGKEWLNGYSDHLPIYMKIRITANNGKEKG
ncbi:MAG: endonuclease/exonuclease/phosphatase family protein [Bacteroidia bacterium]